MVTRSYWPVKASAGRLDRRWVAVEAGDLRRRVGVGEDEGGGPVAAADVGNPGSPGQGVLDAVEGGDPCRCEVGQVSRTKEALAAGVDVAVVVAPRHAVAGAEPLRDAVGGVDRTQGGLEGADDARRAGLVGEGDGVLVGQVEASVACVGQVTAGGLGQAPLADVALGGACAGGDFGRGGRPRPGQGPV
jgi:hypothetical protein